MSPYNNFNQHTIDEFRSNNGKVGGYFANATLLLLTTVGAKSGQSRTTPVAYVTDGDRLVIIASKGGAPSHPDWYYNLLANPVATVEVGTERFQVRASTTNEPERSQLYAKMVEMMPGFALVLGKTRRTIPVLTLMRIASAQE